MSTNGDDHDHDHARTFVPDEEESLGHYAIVEMAVRELLIDKGLFTPDEFRQGLEVVDKAGQLIAEAGELLGIDSTSLASLTAGCVAATGGLAKIVGEEEFPIHFHQGQRDNLHMTLGGDRMILVIVFDERSSPGLVRPRVQRPGQALTLQGVHQMRRHRRGTEPHDARIDFRDGRARRREGRGRGALKLEDEVLACENNVQRPIDGWSRRLSQ